MKAIIVKAAVLTITLLAFNSSALADTCASGEFIMGSDGQPVCKVVNELPEPSSPMLFLVAAGVAGFVMKMRKKK